MAKKESSSGTGKSSKTQNKKILAKRIEDTETLSTLFSEKMGPMLGKVIQRKDTGKISSGTGTKTTSSVETSASASAPAAPSGADAVFVRNPSAFEFSGKEE